MIPRNGQEFRCRIGRLQNSPTEVSGFAAYAEPESAPRKGSSPTLLLNTETLEISWPAHRPSWTFVETYSNFSPQAINARNLLPLEAP